MGSSVSGCPETPAPDDPYKGFEDYLLSPFFSCMSIYCSKTMLPKLFHKILSSHIIASYILLFEESLFLAIGSLSVPQT